MPAVERIIPAGSKEFWDAIDPDNAKQVLEAVKEKLKRPEPAWEMHYLSSTSMGSTFPVKDRKPCYANCLVFLLRGAFIIKGQGRVAETGCVYRVKDETLLWLCGTTTIVIMEEAEQRGQCLGLTQVYRDLILAERDGARKERRRAKKQLREEFREFLSPSELRRP